MEVRGSSTYPTTAPFSALLERNENLRDFCLFVLVVYLSKTSRFFVFLLDYVSALQYPSLLLIIQCFFYDVSYQLRNIIAIDDTNCGI